MISQGVSVVYGVVTRNGVQTDCALTLDGAKDFAARHGARKITRRENGRSFAPVIVVKEGGIWQSLK